MMLESGKHPGAIKTWSVSPGGTTIEAAGFEKGAFRASTIEAVAAAGEKGARHQTRDGEGLNIDEMDRKRRLGLEGMTGRDLKRLGAQNVRVMDVGGADVRRRF